MLPYSSSGSYNTPAPRFTPAAAAAPAPPPASPSSPVAKTAQVAAQALKQESISSNTSLINDLFAPGRIKKVSERNASQIIFRLKKCLSFTEVLTAIHKILPMNELLNESNLIDLLKIEGSEEDWNYQKTIFNQAPESHITTAVCELIVKRAAERKDYEQVTKTYERAKSQNCLNNVIRNGFIEAAGHALHFTEAAAVFHELTSAHQPDADTYRCYIFAAGHTGHFEEAYQVFREIQDSDYVSDRTYADMIAGARLAKRFDVAQEVFLRAQQSRSDSRAVCQEFFQCAIETQHFAEMVQAYRSAKKNGLADTPFCHEIIKALIEANRFDEAHQLLDYSRELNLPDTETNQICDLILKKALENRNFEETTKAYERARAYNLTTPLTYIYYIKAAGLHRQFEAAQAAFTEAKETKQADKRTYSSFIKAAGVAGKFEAAQAAFSEALENNLFDSITFGCFIDVAGQTRHLNEARSAFAKAYALGLADRITLNIYIDVLMAANLKKEAKDLFTDWRVKGRISLNKEIINGTEVLNLHGCSHGLGFLMLENYLNANQDRDNIMVIVGRGSEEGGNYLHFKNVLKTYVKNNLVYWECEQDNTDKGYLIINKKRNKIVRRRK